MWCNFLPKWACLIEAKNLLWSVVILLSCVLEMLCILHASDRLSRGLFYRLICFRKFWNQPLLVWTLAFPYLPTVHNCCITALPLHTPQHHRLTIFVSSSSRAYWAISIFTRKGHSNLDKKSVHCLEHLP